MQRQREWLLWIVGVILGFLLSPVSPHPVSGEFPLFYGNGYAYGISDIYSPQHHAVFYTPDTNTTETWVGPYRIHHFAAVNLRETYPVPLEFEFQYVGNDVYEESQVEVDYYATRSIVFNIGEVGIKGRGYDWPAPEWEVYKLHSVGRYIYRAITQIWEYVGEEPHPEEVGVVIDAHDYLVTYP